MARTWRAATLCHLAHRARGRLAISVKRIDGGRVSNWLLDHLQVGSTLTTQSPDGSFHLSTQHQQPLLLLSAGSGVLIETRDRGQVLFCFANVSCLICRFRHLFLDYVCSTWILCLHVFSLAVKCLNFSHFLKCSILFLEHHHGNMAFGNTCW